jgi:hypothetical protein
MATVNELAPLPGYNSSAATDINANGNVVGQSSDAKASNMKQAPSATFWPLGGSPAPIFKWPDPTSWYESNAICINGQDEILCEVELSGVTTYFLRLSENDPVINLGQHISNLEAAVDLNDQSQLLVRLKNGELVICDAHNLTNPMSMLPAYPEECGSDANIIPIGIDNHGMVVIWCFNPLSAMNDTSVCHAWKPANPNQWQDLPFSGYFAMEPYLGKSGVILIMSGSPYDFSSQPNYIQLHINNPEFAFPVSGGNNSYRFLVDGTDDWLVGGESDGANGYSPILYDRAKYQVAPLKGNFPIWWHPSYATGIAGKRIIGVGGLGLLGYAGQRGWMLDMTSSKRSHIIKPGGQHWLGAPHQPDWVAPEPPPVEVAESLIRSMNQEERKHALVQARSMVDSASEWEKALETVEA